MVCLLAGQPDLDRRRDLSLLSAFSPARGWIKNTGNCGFGQWTLPFPLE